jgi:hypothetical protein
MDTDRQPTIQRAATLDDETLPLRSRRRRVWMLVGQVIGLGLLVAALVVVFSQADLLSRAWTALQSAPAPLLLLVLLSPLISWLLMGVLFWVLTNQYAKVRLGEMIIIMGSAWLLNLLPLRPGLIGRVAYQKTVNNLAVKDSVKVTIFSVVTQVVVLMLMLTVLAVVHFVEALAPGTRALRDALLGSVMLGLLAGLLALAWAAPGLPGAGALEKGPAPMQARRLILAVAIRLVDALVWTVRYALAFHVLGATLAWSDAMILACVSQIVGITPLQLGLREWATGLAARWLPSVQSTAATTAATTTATSSAPVAATGLGLGLTADLLNRAIEIILSVPIGLTCTLILLRRLRAARAERMHTAANATR